MQTKLSFSIKSRNYSHFHLSPFLLPAPTVSSFVHSSYCHTTCLSDRCAGFQQQVEGSKQVCWILRCLASFSSLTITNITFNDFQKRPSLVSQNPGRQNFTITLASALFLVIIELIMKME